MSNIQTTVEKIKEEIRKTPYHKGTEEHIGFLRAKLAKLKDRLEQGKSRGREGFGFAVKKHGDATVVLVGFPSVGKSTLLNKLTNAKSPVGSYTFTTLAVVPGVMKYKGASIQILDVPGLVEGAGLGKGRGKEVLSVMQAADLLLIMAEAGRKKDFDTIEEELGLSGYGNVPVIYVVNKIDLLRKLPGFQEEIHLRGGTEATPPRKSVKISAEKNIGLGALREEIWKALGLKRVYLRNHIKQTDYSQPLIMKKGQTLADVLQRIGSKIAQEKVSAKIWGRAAKFPGQQASLSTRVHDETEVLFF